jgi:hypothetical protein
VPLAAIRGHFYDGLLKNKAANFWWCLMPVYGDDLCTVVTPNGSSLNLQNTDEGVYYERSRDRYQLDNKFLNISDIEELSRLLMLEVMIHRWSNWLAQGFDYNDGKIDEKELKTNLKEFSGEIRQIKSTLGIDRVQREKDKGEDLGQYVANLLKRAKEFGQHRDEQYAKAVTFIWEAISMVKTLDRCDEEERRDLDLSEGSIVEWIRTRLIPEWQQVNDAFRKNQSMWIKSL